MLAANHLTECGVPDGEVGEDTEGVEGGCVWLAAPCWVATLLTGQIPGSFRDWTTT